MRLTHLAVEGYCLGTCFIVTIQFTCLFYRDYSIYMLITCTGAYCIIMITVRICVSPCGIVGVDTVCDPPEVLGLQCMLGDHITSSFIK